MTYLSSFQSPLGSVTLASDGEALTGLWFDGQKYFLQGITGETAQTDDEPAVLLQAKAWLAVYFSGRNPGSQPVPLRPAGTPFQRRVWAALTNIPYGTTVTYGELAKRLGTEKKTSPRAVGNAVGRNPISVFIPCHRVIGADGGLTGYAGGIERKRRLLKTETS